MESTAVPDGVIKSYLSALKDQFDREIRLSTKPNCYQNGAFWVHPKDPYFSLEKSSRTETGVTPSSLYLPSVFLWLPDCLHTGELKCSNPVCQKARTGVALSPKGWNDNPIARRVVGLDWVYYVMTKRVQCARAGNGCGKSWNLYDPNIMEQLDPGLAASFPAFLTHRSGIDKSVMTLIRAGMANSMNSNSWAKLTKFLMKLGGVTIFAGLFTLINEAEQIRYQAFVPTKSLAHIRSGLEEIVRSLQSHGHPAVGLGWTDNVANDAATFLDCIPTLGEKI
ncbi:hypothetical protein FB451DRAFT_1020008, partial [Mycena latifolia]